MFLNAYTTDEMIAFDFINIDINNKTKFIKFKNSYQCHMIFKANECY